MIATWMLVINLMFADETGEWFILAGGMTQEQCENELMIAPLPYQLDGSEVTFACHQEL